MNKIDDLVKNIKGNTYGGSSVRDDTLYHDLPFSGLGHYKVHRGRTRKRIDFINRFRPKGKTILDIGCSVGGISLGMIEKGAKHVTGIDYDKDSIAIAKAAAEHLGYSDKTDFRTETIDIEWIKNMEKVDVIIWLSNWMWMVKEYGMEIAQEMLYEASRKSDEMIFESAANDGKARIVGATQDDIHKWLKQFTTYRYIQRYPTVGGWMNRDLFFLGTPLLVMENTKRTTTAKIERISSRLIKKTFKDVTNEIGQTTSRQQGYKWQTEREVEAYKRLAKYKHYPKVHDYNIEEGWLVMDFVGRCERLPFDKYKNQAIEILDELKAERIEHRDIKHANFCELDGILYLIDFGWCIFDDEEDSPIPASKSLLWSHGYTDVERIIGIFNLCQWPVREYKGCGSIYRIQKKEDIEKIGGLGSAQWERPWFKGQVHSVLKKKVGIIPKAIEYNASEWKDDGNRGYDADFKNYHTFDEKK